MTFNRCLLTLAASAACLAIVHDADAGKLARRKAQPATNCENQQQDVSHRQVAAVEPAKKKKDIVDTAIAAKSFDTLVAAVKAAGLVETLKGEGPFTVFAPTDAAFAKLPKETLADLLKPENKDQLTAILTYHVVPGRVLAKDVTKLDSAKTVNGKSVRIKSKDGAVTIDAAKVVKADIECTNGVIHIIDAVILP